MFISFSFSFLLDAAPGCGFFFPKIMSANNPQNTSTEPNHCRVLSVLPKKNTEKNTVKNLRVVVTTEHASGPYDDTLNKYMLKKCLKKKCINKTYHQKYK